MRTHPTQSRNQPWLELRRLARGVAAITLGLVVPVAVPFLFIRLIAHAQDACFNVAGGHAFYLMVTWLELILAGWILFGVAALVTRRRGLVARIATGMALVIALGLFATWQLVPWGPASDYPTSGDGPCGPGGIPTWWPRILPHH